jgi:hypothetical protein
MFFKKKWFGFFTAHETANTTAESKRSGFIVIGLEFGLKLEEKSG